MRSRSYWEPKSFILGVKVVRIGSQSRSYWEQRSSILGVESSASSSSAVHVRSGRILFLEVQKALFWLFLDVICAWRVGCNSVNPPRKVLSFGCNIFQIAKTCCKYFYLMLIEKNGYDWTSVTSDESLTLGKKQNSLFCSALVFA